MRYATAAAFRTALEQRLLVSSRQKDLPLTRLRKLVVFERLLARLMVVAPDRWILKGAVALHFRLGARFRTTEDYEQARAFLDPVLAGSVPDDARWDPDGQTW